MVETRKQAKEDFTSFCRLQYASWLPTSDIYIHEWICRLRFAKIKVQVQMIFSSNILSAEQCTEPFCGMLCTAGDNSDVRILNSV